MSVAWLLLPQALYYHTLTHLELKKLLRMTPLLANNRLKILTRVIQKIEMYDGTFPLLRKFEFISFPAREFATGALMNKTAAKHLDNFR